VTPDRSEEAIPAVSLITVSAAYGAGGSVVAPTLADRLGVVEAAQARGDFQVLAERKRRALRIHLPSDVMAGLALLEAAVKQALV